jgi:hypothetical protein
VARGSASFAGPGTLTSLPLALTAAGRRALARPGGAYEVRPTWQHVDGPPERAEQRVKLV